MQISSCTTQIYPSTSDILELLFDRLPMGIVVISPDFTIMRYNTTWESFCQHYSPETAQIVHPGANYFHILPLSHSTFEPLFTRALNGEVIRESALCIPTTNASNYYNILVAPIIDDWRVTGILVACSDVTEQVETQLALQTALGELWLSHEAIEQRIDERTRELKTLMTVQQALTSSLNHNEVLHVIAREARCLTHTQVGAVFLPQSDRLLLAALSCEYPIDIEVGYNISLTDSITGAAFCTGRAQLVVDISCHAQVDANAITKGKLKSILSIPLISGTRTIGVLSVGNKTGGVLSTEEERLLNLMVPSSVIALENVNMYERASETAVAEERGRLARDLHDSVTQTLFSASLTAEVLPRIWLRNPDEGMIRLEELRGLTRSALAEMRTLLLELRPSALAEMPLCDSIRQLIEGIAGRTHIEIHLNVTGENDPAPDVKIALYRIAQEALSNVIKHARAKLVDITLTQANPTISLTIKDDGIGFKPSENRANHLGLRIMAERVEEIKGNLKIEAVPDYGTTITVSWREQEP